MPRSQVSQSKLMDKLLAQGALALPDACKAIRRSQGLSQDEFAMRSGVNRKVIKDLERGQGNPTLHSLTCIGRAAGLRVAFLPDDGVVGLLDAKKRLAQEEARRAADAAELQRGLSPKALHRRNALSLGDVKLRLPKIA